MQRLRLFTAAVSGTSTSSGTFRSGRVGRRSARPAMAFSRRQLIDEVWGTGWIGDEHLVDVHIAHLRKKLDDDPGTARYITTVRGVGYRMGKG